MRNARRLVLLLAALVPGWALGLGFELGESKEKLKLDYELAAYDHDTGRVTLTFTLVEAGRLAPLESVDLVVGSEDGTGHVDLSIALEGREEDGKRTYRVHIHRTLAERASIRLKTWHFDGKATPRTWYYHRIPLGPAIVDLEPFQRTVKGGGEEGGKKRDDGKEKDEE